MAIVSPDAKLGRNVEVGPFCRIDSGVVIGDDCQLASGVVVHRGTRLGQGNQVFEGTILGASPQHLNPPQDQGDLWIGDNNVIREHVTIHRALHRGNKTCVGSGCLIMIGAHVAHDCKVGNQVVMTNHVLLAGHVEVGDRAYLGGASAVHQFCRIGQLAMIGGMARVTQDVPPFVTVDGGTTMVVGLNKVGLRRAGFAREDLAQLKQAYRLIYREGHPWKELVELLKVAFAAGPAARYADFFASGSRGFVRERRVPTGATLRLHREDAGETRLRQAG